MAGFGLHCSARLRKDGLNLMSGGSLMYDSPPISRKPRLQKQTSLDETHKKKGHNLHSPPMKKKSLPSSPPITERDEPLFDELTKDENQNTVNGTKKKHARRRVSFADAVGKELEHVLTFEDPEDVAAVKVKEMLPEMKPLELTLPLLSVDSESFKERLEKNSMIVEKLTLGTANVSGRIRVKNVQNDDWQRRVSVRYTKDGWMSFTKQPARPLPKVKSENDETASFDLYCFDVAVDVHSPAVQFFITSCDSQGKAEFEDNNGGESYTVLNPNYLPPPEEEDEEEGWEAWMRGDDEWCNDYY